MNPEYTDYNFCPDCGEPRGVCQCSDDDLDEYMDDYEFEEAPRCGCPFCYCINTTIAGETCDQCLEGAHQG